MPGITCTPVQKVLGAMTMSEAPTSPTSMSARTPCVKTLVVDDNPITAKLLSRILSREFGHAIVTAESGKDALNKLRAEAFDIIFMDIDMPELSGIETTMAIRSATSCVLEGNRTIPIIAYTTNPCERSYLDAGMKGWVGKPANNLAVRKELERVYTCSSSRRRLSTAAQTVSTQQSC